MDNAPSDPALTVSAELLYSGNIIYLFTLFRNAFQSYETLQNEIMLHFGDGSAPSALEILSSSGVCVEDILPFRELRAKAVSIVYKYSFVA